MGSFYFAEPEQPTEELVHHPSPLSPVQPGQAGGPASTAA